MCPEELVDRFYAAVYNLAYRTLGRREDAEDVAQQTFAQALPHLDDLRQPHAVGGWLLRIAANITLDELRRRGRRASLNEDPATDWSALPDPDRLTAPAGALELHELRVDVWRAALALPPQQRLALALREMHGMRYAEIADALHITLAAVETLLFRARQGFRRAYAGVGEMPASSDGTCRAILVQLSASIDSELEQREHEQVADHLRGCPTCQIAARELRATSRLYSLLPMLNPAAAAKVSALLGASAAVGAGSAAGAGTIALTGAGAAAVGTATVGASALGAVGTVPIAVSALAAVIVAVGAAASSVWVADASRAPVVEVPRVVQVATPVLTATSVVLMLPADQPATAPAPVTATPSPTAAAPTSAPSTPTSEPTIPMMTAANPQPADAATADPASPTPVARRAAEQSGTRTERPQPASSPSDSAAPPVRDDPEPTPSDAQEDPPPINHGHGDEALASNSHPDDGHPGNSQSIEPPLKQPPADSGLAAGQAPGSNAPGSQGRQPEAAGNGPPASARDAGGPPGENPAPAHPSPPADPTKPAVGPEPKNTPTAGKPAEVRPPAAEPPRQPPNPPATPRQSTPVEQPSRQVGPPQQSPRSSGPPQAQQPAPASLPPRPPATVNQPAQPPSPASPPRASAPLQHDARP